jgi:tetratricopeptide (TPR) repeat protein
MYRIAIILAIILLVPVTVYFAIGRWDWSWWAVAVTALLGLVGMYLVYRRPRYAALFAAIDLLFLTYISAPLSTIIVMVDVPKLGNAGAGAQFKDPDAWPGVVGALFLLSYQVALELMERKILDKLPALFSVRILNRTGDGSLSINRSTVQSAVSGNVGDNNSAPVQIGSYNTLTQVYADPGAEIDAAARLLDKRYYSAAKDAFEAVEKKYGSSLTEHQRYRILANLGTCYAQHGNHEKSIDLFHQAAAATEDEIRAGLCLAQASRLRDDSQAAYRIANDILSRQSTHVEAAAIRVVSDESEATTEFLLQELPVSTRVELPVIRSAILRDQILDNLDLAELRARTVLSRWPDDRDIKESLATVIVVRLEGRLGSQSLPTSVSESDRARLNEAVDLLTTVLLLPAQESTPYLRAELLRKRGLARWFLGDVELAMQDWEEAALTGTDVNHHVLPYLSKLQQREGVNRAIELLQKIDGRFQDPRLPIGHAEFLLHRDNAGDLQNSESLLKTAIAQGQVSHKDTLVGACLLLADVQGKLQKSWLNFQSEVSDVRLHVSDCAWYSIQSNAASSFGNAKEAIVQSDFALLHCTLETAEDEVRFLGSLLRALGRKAECAILLSRLFKSDSLTSSTHDMLDSALESGLHALYLREAKRLRGSGIVGDRLIKNEAALLANYHAMGCLLTLETDAAKASASPDTMKWIRFARTIVAVENGQLSFAEADPNLLPALETLPIRELSHFVKVMRFGPGVSVGRDQLYHAIRKNRDAREFKAAFWSLSHLVDDYDRLPAVDMISTGCAFQVKDSGDSEVWYVLEPDSPQRAFREFSPSDAAIIPFIGKRVGDTVLVSRGLQTVQLTVQQIVDKRRHLLLSIMDDAHDADSFLIRFQVPKASDKSLWLKIIGIQMQFWNSETSEQFRTYQEQIFPLTVLAAALQRPLAAVWRHVASTPELPFRVVDGHSEEFQVAASVLQSGTSFVLDPTAAMTLFYTGMWKYLDPAGIKLVIPVALLNEFWCLIADDPFREDGSHTLFAVGGFPVSDVTTIESWVRFRWRVGQFLQWLQSSCRLADSLPLARLSPNKRRSLKLLGFSTAAAIAIASAEGLPLLTDDTFVSHMADDELNLKNRVWTLLLCEHAHANGTLSANEYQRIKSDLYAWGAQHFILESDLLLFAGDRSDWDPRTFPLSGILAWFSNATLIHEVVTGVAADCFKALHKKSLLAHQEDDALRGILSSIMRRPDGRTICDKLIGVLPALFRFEVVHQNRIREIALQSR